MRTTLKRFGYLCVALGLGTAAAANTSADRYTWGPLERTSQGLWINNNIPSGCQWTITTAGQKWTDANLHFTFVWSGYVTPQSWNWNSLTNTYSSTTANTIATQVEGGHTDSVNDAAQTHRIAKSKTGDPNIISNTDRYVFSDADVVFNYNRFSTDFWCSTSLAPGGTYDVSTIILHELGHVLGLEHDLDDTADVTVVNNPLYAGQNKRDLTTRDVDRAVYLYGAP